MPRNSTPITRTRESLAAKAQAMVDQLVSRARAKEAAPETAVVVLPGAPSPLRNPNLTLNPSRRPAPRRFRQSCPRQVRLGHGRPGGVSGRLKLPPASAAEYNARGRKLLQEDRYQEAIEQLTEALKLDPSLSLACNARGFAHFRLKQYPEALADFNQAIRLNPSYLNAYVNRSAARRAAGDQTGADADQAKARELMQGR